MDKKEMDGLVGTAVETAIVAFEERQVANEAKAAQEKELVELKAAKAELEVIKTSEEWKASKGSFNIKKATELGSDEKELERSFAHYLATGDDAVARKALQEDDGAEGGYLVPNDFMATIISKRDPMSWPRRAGVQIVTTKRDNIDIPAEATSFAKFSRTAEEASYTTNDPSFGQNNVVVQKWTKLFRLSEELAVDNATGLEGWLATAIARSMADTEAYYCAIGTGTNQHEGVFVGGTTNGLTFDSTGNITPDEIWELFYTLGTGYHADAIWLMDPQTWRYLLSLRDANNWSFSAADMATINVEGAEGELFGKRVYLQDDIPTMSTGVNPIMVGDPFYYALVEREGLSVRRLNELYAATGQIGFKCNFRQSGKVLVEEAFMGGIMA